MKRAFVDVDTFASRNMAKDKNIDYQFWFNKTIEEKHFIVYGPSSPKMYLQQSPGFVSSITGKVRV